VKCWLSSAGGIWNASTSAGSPSTGTGFRSVGIAEVAHLAPARVHLFTYSVYQRKALPAGIRQQWARTLDRIGGKLVSNSFESHLEKTNLRFPIRNSSPDIILVGVRHSTSKIDRRKFLWMKRAIRK
jgi:hypothetical protein